MADVTLDFQQAETWRKAGQYAEACPVFQRLWEEKGSPSAGWRYAYCLRKMDQPEAALQRIEQVVARYPNDPWVRSEHVWCLYEVLVKPARDEGHLGKLLYAGQKILEAGAEDLALRRTIFTIVTVAREKGKWDIVSEWCDRLDPQQLSAEPTVVRDKPVMPEREQWYFAKVKALVKLEQWAEARRLALEAAQAFPRRLDFPRWAAQARAGEGDIAGAIEELEVLTRRGNPPWYILADIAEMRHHLGQDKEALQTAAKAALATGEDKAKVNLYVLTAESALAAGEPEVAAWHIALSKAVRQREGWPIREDLARLERRTAELLAQKGAPPLDLPLDADRLHRGCEKIWREWATAGLERKTGVICSLPEERDFGFIAPDDGGDHIYFKRREIPRRYAKVGQRVDFAIEQSYDPVKKRDSVRAVDIRPVGQD